MATLKEHQAAMVDLLANGSGIPASASRLAHAMHDVLGAIVNGVCDNTEQLQKLISDATTPGLNDKALSKPQKALKTDSPVKWPTPAEQRVKELENTIRQLKANNAKLKDTVALQKSALDAGASCAEIMPLQAGCRKPDTQVCRHHHTGVHNGIVLCVDCGKHLRKECNHESVFHIGDICPDCGETVK